MLAKIILQISRGFDQFQSYWETKKNHQRVGTLLVTTFLLSAFITILHYLNLLPQIISDWVSINKYFAIEAAFTLLLIIEVFSLIFALARSVSTALVKQFEIFSLILLRSSFKQFGNLDPNLDWKVAIEPVAAMLSDAFGALIIFVLILVISRIQKHTPITSDPVDQTRFILVKKNSAVLLFAVFVISGIIDMAMYVFHGIGFNFFTNFYTILIFNDILLVLISLRYNYSYIVVFRNSAFAVATLVIRMALTAPPFFNSALSILAGLFALGTMYYYNKFVTFSLIDKK